MVDSRKYPYPYHGQHVGILSERRGTCTWTGILKALGEGGWGAKGNWKKCYLQVKGLALEQSVNEDSIIMTTPVQHYGKVNLGDKTTTRGS